MKKVSIRGVTLLEIMLVLAIAAMIIVMSIRYYQTASTSQQANAALGQIQAVMAAADSLGLNGGYTNNNVTSANITAMVGANNMSTPWGKITVTPVSATTYTLTATLSSAVCPNVLSKLTGNSKITTQPCSSGTLTFTYNSAG